MLETELNLLVGSGSNQHSLETTPGHEIQIADKRIPFGANVSQENATP